MISKPNFWSDNDFGGFLINSEEKNDLITKSNQHKHIIENRDKLYNAINYLNSIKFKINKSLIHFVRRLKVKVKLYEILI